MYYPRGVTLKGVVSRQAEAEQVKLTIALVLTTNNVSPTLNKPRVFHTIDCTTELSTRNNLLSIEKTRSNYGHGNSRVVGSIPNRRNYISVILASICNNPVFTYVT